MYMNIENLERRFSDIYGHSPQSVYFAPGRVNLIGEHIDYNGGRVFPCALDFGTYMCVSSRNDGKISMRSLNMPSGLLSDNDNISDKKNDWTDYPAGVFVEFSGLGYSEKGFDILYWGNIPARAGLSSSASLEVVTAVMLDDVYASELGRKEIARLSQRAENGFVGMNCGIMDQFAVAFGARNMAIALDCSTLDYELVTLDMDGYGLVIANSNKHHELVSSEYNTRRMESEAALEILRSKYGISHLCELSSRQLAESASMFRDDRIFRRARHAVSENERVTKAIACLKEGNLAGFGRLMNESHASLKCDYEVTGREMDILAEEALKIEGVLGSRITGGGFGGCTVSLVKKENIERFVSVLGETYKLKTGLKADFYVADIGDGARKLK